MFEMSNLVSYNKWEDSIYMATQLIRADFSHFVKRDRDFSLHTIYRKTLVISIENTTICSFLSPSYEWS